MDLEERKKKIAALIAQGGIVTPQTLADATEQSALDACRCLPEGMAAFAPGEDFEEIWNVAASWERATFIAMTRGGVLEIEGRLSRGRNAMGYFNLFDKDAPLHGHLKPNEVAAIGLASIPFMGRESHAIHFFSSDGDLLYSVHVGRRNHEIIKSALDSFLSLKDRLSAKGAGGE